MSMEYQELQEEVIEILKGDFKTTLIVKFNKQGQMVSHTIHSEDTSRDRELIEKERADLMKALEEQRLDDAKMHQENINSLRHLMKVRKPTF
jgi:hypothetical protein